MSADWYAKIDARIEQQECASIRLKELAAKIGEECHSIWEYGDGNGGYVISIIEEEIYKHIDRPEKLTSASRKPISKAIKTMVLERDSYRCVTCGEYHRLVIDHIHPVAKGGSDHPDNLQTLCWPCNSLKKDKVA